MIRGSLRYASFRDEWMAMLEWTDDGVEVLLDELQTGEGRVFVTLRGTKHIALRFSEDSLLCADDQGRVIALNLRTKAITRDIRV